MRTTFAGAAWFCGCIWLAVFIGSLGSWSGWAYLYACVPCGIAAATGAIAIDHHRLHADKEGER